MKNMIKRFMKDERGLELSEYAVLLALIIVAILVAVRGLSTAISTKFTQTATTLNAETP